MKAFQDALGIRRDEMGSRLELAVEFLLERRGTVLLEEFVALVPDQNAITCEVVTRHTAQQVDARAYQNELAEAQSLFASSTLAQELGEHALSWCVVDDYGMGRALVYPAG